MAELTDRQKQVNAAALQFINGHTPIELVTQGTSDERERAINSFWDEVTTEIKRIIIAMWSFRPGTNWGGGDTRR